MINIPEFKFIESTSTKLGCYSNGYCFDCGIIVEDGTCYCIGSNCPRCGKMVPGGNTPNNLDGVYPVYKRVPKTYYYVEYQNGKWFKSYTVDESLALWEEQCNQN